MLGQQARHQRTVADIAFHEHVVGIAFQAGEGLQVAGVGQGIQVDDLDAAGNRLEDEVAANESGTAGD
ncbi:hypothetical protein GCM10027214_07930 [Stenotrophomonas tumulicola]